MARSNLDRGLVLQTRLGGLGLVDLLLFPRPDNPRQHLDDVAHLARLRLERLAGAGRLLGVGGIGLRHMIELRDRRVDLFDPLGLLDGWREATSSTRLRDLLRSRLTIWLQ